MQDKIMNGLAVSQQIIEPLAPNRPLTPITWKSAPKDPHGYYDRNNYARGWNDAVAKAEKLLTIIGYAYQIAGAHDCPDYILDVLADPEEATTEQIEKLLPYQPKQPELEYQVWVSAQPSYWREAQFDEYSTTRKDERRIVQIIEE